jgi:hypothetical protein
MNEQPINCGCGKIVEDERVTLLNSRICASCARVTQKNWQKPKGVMVWEGKTAPTIQILSAEQFNNHRVYSPYGRHTGRGSGIHRVTKTTSCM